DHYSDRSCALTTSRLLEDPSASGRHQLVHAESPAAHGARIDAVDRVHRDSERLFEPMERQDDGEDSAEEP
ncbi:hypothetical protein KUCAC02_001924, partial [Chaenocephalus aceratus]